MSSVINRHLIVDGILVPNSLMDALKIVSLQNEFLKILRACLAEQASLSIWYFYGDSVSRVNGNMIRRHGGNFFLINLANFSHFMAFFVIQFISVFYEVDITN